VPNETIESEQSSLMDRTRSGEASDMLRRALRDITGTLYLCALIANRPRAIDRNIDYFGGA